MIRLFLLIVLTATLFCCGGNGETVAQSASTSAPSDLKLTEKGRIISAVTLTLADGPFAGTYELENDKSKGNVRFSAATAKHVKKHPKFAGTSNLTMFSMLTEDGSFGIKNLHRVFTGDPQTGHLPSVTRERKNGGNTHCGTMNLQVPDSGYLRHVYVDFVDCAGIDITGFGSDWKEAKYSPTRTRPVAGKLSERVRIRDINSTSETENIHETTMTIEFVGGQDVEM